jgi:hypothetical protein
VRDERRGSRSADENGSGRVGAAVMRCRHPSPSDPGADRDTTPRSRPGTTSTDGRPVSRSGQVGSGGSDQGGCDRQVGSEQVSGTAEAMARRSAPRPSPEPGDLGDEADEHPVAHDLPEPAAPSTSHSASRPAGQHDADAVPGDPAVVDVGTRRSRAPRRILPSVCAEAARAPARTWW